MTYFALLCANIILTSAMPMLIILGGLAGLALAPSPVLVTLPASVQALAGLIAAGPVSFMMGRLGRRFGFMAGASMAVAGGGMGAAALAGGSFWLLCLAHAALGVALASYQFFRFAAVEVVPPARQPLAISLMMTSGLVAALAGPQVIIWTNEALSSPLAGGYVAIAALSLLGLLPLTRAPSLPSSSARGRSFALLRQPMVMKAVGLGAVSQGVMILLMAPTTVAMSLCGFASATSSDVIRWHVIAMFAPSLLTGFAIRRFGTAMVLRAGLVLMAGSACVAMSGITAAHFYFALILLGLGWNFGFIGATTRLAELVPPEGRAMAQGANETVIALAGAVCAAVSGALVTGPGWSVLAVVALGILVSALGLTFFPHRKGIEST